MAIIDLLSEKTINISLVSRKKEDLIGELVNMMHSAGFVQYPEDVITSVLEREQMGSTGLDKGIAVPHARTAEVQDLCVGLGISSKGIDFDALDGEFSHLFFLILTRPDQSSQHIQVLSEIAGISKSADLCEQLRYAENAESVIELLKNRD